MKNTTLLYLILLSVSLLLPNAIQSQGLFGPQQLISPKVKNPIEIQMVDLNGDGENDVLCLSGEDGLAQYESKISWYENDDFENHQEILHSFEEIYSFYVSDLGNDGDWDILITSDQKTAWLENDGNALFVENIITENNGPNTVDRADFDGDGDLDIVLSSLNDNKIVWFENMGNGEYGMEQTISTDLEAPRLVYSVDLDSDGDQDVLSVANGERVYWYENDGEGHFGLKQYIFEQFAWQDPLNIELGDFDFDGDVDMLFYFKANGEIYWHKNEGNGEISSDKTFIVSFNSVFDKLISVNVIDLDNDGDIDILGASDYDGDNVLVWYENDGNGDFEYQELGVYNDNNDLYVHSGDLDSDGDNDILINWEYHDRITWYENEGNGNFASEEVLTPSTSGVISVYSDDIDGDGDPDIIAASKGDDKVTWYENQGNGQFSAEKIIATDLDGARCVYSSDLDGDGDQDVLVAIKIEDKVSWFENDGSGVFGPEQVINLDIDNVRSVYSSDLDGDGDQDVLAASYTDGKIAWYENDGNGGFGPEQIITNNLFSARCVYSSDLDGDGDQDVISGYNHIIWYENDGSGDFTTHNLPNTASGSISSITSNDLDGDGDLDVLLGSYGGYYVAWHENLGNGEFSNSIIIDDIGLGEISSVFSIDFDRDGDQDVLAASYGYDKILWYENIGNGEFEEDEIISYLTEGAESIYAIDFDNDNLPDVISASRLDDKVAWYKNLAALAIEVSDTLPACINTGVGSLEISLVGQLNFPPYTYEWVLDDGVDSGSGVSETEIFSLDNLVEGSYDFMVVNVEQDTSILENFILSEAPLPIINTQSLIYTCETELIFLSALVENSNQITWESDGDGSFGYDDILNPVYSLGENDIMNERVDLRVKAQSLVEGCEEAIADITVIFVEDISLQIEEECDTLTGNYILKGQLEGGTPAYDESAYHISCEYFEFSTTATFTSFINGLTAPTNTPIIVTDDNNCRYFTQFKIDCFKSISVMEESSLEIQQFDNFILIRGALIRGYQLLSINGQVMQFERSDTYKDQLFITTAQLATGAYLLELRLENESVIRKIWIH